MLAYVHLVRRIGEHRRENIFFRGSSLEKKCFSFLQEISVPLSLDGGRGVGRGALMYGSVRSFGSENR